MKIDRPQGPDSAKRGKLRGRKRCRTSTRIVISNYYWCKSFVDDLIGTGYCTCESRLVLRSTEIQPLFYDLFSSPPSLESLLGLHSSANPGLQQLVLTDCPDCLLEISILPITPVFIDWGFGVLGFWGFGVRSFRVLEL